MKKCLAVMLIFSFFMSTNIATFSMYAYAAEIKTSNRSVMVTSSSGELVSKDKKDIIVGKKDIRVSTGSLSTEFNLDFNVSYNKDDKFKQKGKSAGEKIGGAIGGFFGNIVDTAKAVTGTIAAAGKAVVKGAVSVGKAAVNGAINLGKAAVNVTVNAGKVIAGGVVKAVTLLVNGVKTAVMGAVNLGIMVIGGIAYGIKMAVDGAIYIVAQGVGAVIKVVGAGLDLVKAAIKVSVNGLNQLGLKIRNMLKYLASFKISAGFGDKDLGQDEYKFEFKLKEGAHLAKEVASSIEDAKKVVSAVNKLALTTLDASNTMLINKYLSQLSAIEIMLKALQSVSREVGNVSGSTLVELEQTIREVQNIEQMLLKLKGQSYTTTKSELTKANEIVVARAESLKNTSTIVDVAGSNVVKSINTATEEINVRRSEIAKQSPTASDITAVGKATDKMLTNASDTYKDAVSATASAVGKGGEVIAQSTNKVNDVKQAQMGKAQQNYMDAYKKYVAVYQTEGFSENAKKAHEEYKKALNEYQSLKNISSK